MKVEIEAGGRSVKIECGDANVSTKDVAAEALALWRATQAAHPPGTEGPGYGFQAELRGRQQSPMNMGGYGGEYVSDPVASTEVLP